MLALQRVFVFRTDRRTDTTCKNNDYIFGRGLVGQYLRPDLLLASQSSAPQFICSLFEHQAVTLKPFRFGVLHIPLVYVNLTAENAV